MSRELDEAIIFHKRLDKICQLESPNRSWPPELIEYYNAKEIEDNEKENA